MDMQQPQSSGMLDRSLAAAGPGEEDDAGLDIRAWLRTLRRHKVLIVSVIVIVMVATLFVLNDITPRYTATSKVLIQTQASNVMDFEAVMSGIGSDTAAVASQVEILTSRSLMGRLADELNLIEDPEFNPYRRPEKTGLAALSVEDVVPEWLLAAFGQRDAEGMYAEEPTPEEQQEIERTAVINNLLAAIEVQPVRLTYVITLAATSTSPQKAATLSNGLAKLYILDQLEAKFEATEQANVWLSSRLEELRQQVIDAEALVAAYRVEQNLGNSNSQSLIEQQLNQASAQLTLARSELAAAQANYSQVERLQSQGTDSAAQVLSSSLIQELRTQEAEAKRRLAELQSRYGELHPDVINAKAEIQDIELTIQSEVSKIVQNLANEVAVARARAASIEATVNELNDRFN
ncbi:MAG: GumC family protein, partial [Pseudomonadales bacterium]|nr:GumC family protein [Pseudomonadales bacterium]